MPCYDGRDLYNERVDNREVEIVNYLNYLKDIKMFNTEKSLSKIEKDKYFENKYKAKKVIANLLFILDIKNNKIDNENVILTNMYDVIQKSFFNEENINSLTLIKKSKLNKIINSIQKKYDIRNLCYVMKVLNKEDANKLCEINKGLKEWYEEHLLFDEKRK